MHAAAVAELHTLGHTLCARTESQIHRTRARKKLKEGFKLVPVAQKGVQTWAPSSLPPSWQTGSVAMQVPAPGWFLWLQLGILAASGHGENPNVLLPASWHSSLERPEHVSPPSVTALRP